jgi:predicted phosphodiesterase
MKKKDALRLLSEHGLDEKTLRKILSGRHPRPRIITRHITDREFQFAIVSDTHMGSVYEKLNELKTFYEICRKMGIKDVLHAGDLIQGQRMYPGWEMETNVFGANPQVEYVVKNYPKVAGITTYFILGSHDTCFWKASGIEVGDLISEKRKDLIYLGQYQGDVVLNEIKIRLIHPTGGVPYSLSYRGQKIAEQIPSGQKPHILVLGHLHVAYYFPYRLIQIIGAGAFQDQTPYLLQKGLQPNVGGWTVKVRLAKYRKQSVVAITPSWIPFL